MFNILIFNFDVNTEVNTVLIFVPCFACQSIVEKDIQDALSIAKFLEVLEQNADGNNFTERVYIITIKSSSRNFVVVRYL